MKGVRIILLCEDKQTDSFVRRFLKHRKFTHRDINTLPLPHGGQSGEQWVRQRYPTELKAIRERQRDYLSIVTDADNRTAEDRRQQLEAECQRKGVPPRTAEDRVIIVVPRRNIETWFAYLDGSDVDEQRTYPKLARESDCNRHARALYGMCHVAQRLRDPVPPALVEACGEYRKLQGG